MIALVADRIAGAIIIGILSKDGGAQFLLVLVQFLLFLEIVKLWDPPPLSWTCAHAAYAA